MSGTKKQAYHNVAGLVRDMRALRYADEGDEVARELYDALCHELDMYAPIGSDDDGGCDVGHDEGGEEPEEPVADNTVDVPRGTVDRMADNRAGARTVRSVRGGTRTAILNTQSIDRCVVGRGGRRG